MSKMSLLKEFRQDMNCTHAVFGRSAERLAILFTPHTTTPISEQKKAPLYILKYRRRKKKKNLTDYVVAPKGNFDKEQLLDIIYLSLPDFRASRLSGNEICQETRCQNEKIWSLQVTHAKSLLFMAPAFNPPTFEGVSVVNSSLVKHTRRL